MFRKVDPRIWNDAKFHGFGTEAKLAFIYLLTAPRLTRLGAIPVTWATLLEEVSTPCATRCATPWQTAFKTLVRDGAVSYDERGLFWLKNYLRFNPPDNPSVVKGWQTDIDSLPECSLLAEILANARSACESRGDVFLKAFEKLSLPKLTKDRDGHGVAHGALHGVAHQEQEKEKEQESISSSQSSEEIPLVETETVPDLSRCPYREIIKAYHEELPTLPKVLIEVFEANPTRQKAVKARWTWFTEVQGCKTQAEGIAQFRAFFRMVASSDFLTGKASNWRADFDWLMNRANFGKVLERRYEH